MHPLGCVLCCIAILATLGACGHAATRRGTGSIPQLTNLPRPRIPQSFLAIANYSPTQIVYEGDLKRFNTKWWLGGYTLTDDANQGAMLRHGYHYLPTFNAGYQMRAFGLTSIPAATTRLQDPHSCIDTACTLNSAAILAAVQRIQGLFGTHGNYYSIGNEVDLAGSDDVSPAVYVGQFDAWVNAIKAGDPAAHIVAPSISAPGCCTDSATNPFGTGAQWLQAFVTDYEQVHNGAKPPIDVLAMHLYNYDDASGTTTTPNPGYYLGQVQSLRREADSLGYTHTPIWITELGFAYPPGVTLSSEQTQQITRTLTALADYASSLDLQRVFLYTNGEQAAIAAGARPLYEPGAGSSPLGRMPLTQYGQLAAKLADTAR